MFSDHAPEFNVAMPPSLF